MPKRHTSQHEQNQLPPENWDTTINTVMPSTYGEHYATLMTDAYNLHEDYRSLPRTNLADDLLARIASGELLCKEAEGGDYILFLPPKPL